MVHNTARARLLAGETALGTVVGGGSPTIAAMLAHAGFDLVLLDGQHGDWDDSSLLVAFGAIAHSRAVPMARVRYNDYGSIGRLLDRGALGIVVPMVNSADEARAAAFAMRYPPRGGRSYAGTLAVHYGDDHGAWSDDEVFLAVQIETAAGLEDVDAIMAVDGVDACWIGPVDLARSMGLDMTRDEDVARHEAAVRRILAATVAAGKVPGIFTPDVETARRRIAAGFRFVTVSGDGALVADGARAILRDLGR